MHKLQKTAGEKKTLNPSYFKSIIRFSLFLIVLMSDEQKDCSCYTFGDAGSSMTWRQAKVSCEYNNETLVVIETEEEWEFISKRIKDLTDVPNHEWHIGLYKNRSSGKWTWINGKPLAQKIRWQYEPGKNQHYAVISNDRPSVSYGTFKSINGSVQIRWICEEQTGINTALQ